MKLNNSPLFLFIQIYAKFYNILLGPSTCLVWLYRFFLFNFVHVIFFKSKKTEFQRISSFLY